MNRANGVTDRTARKIESRFEGMNRRLTTGFTGLQRGIAGAFATAAALRGAQQLVDSSTRIENSLKVAGLAGDDLKEVYDSLYASAQRNAAPIESLVTLYGRAAIVQKELGVSTEELLGFTNNVSLALRVAGTDAQTASGSLLQLSQALGAGTVRAEEFNSILEGALPIAQAAAAGLEEAGGSVAKLRALVVDGKVSSEAFFRAFEAGSVILEEKVAGSELTVSQAFVRLQNVLIDAAGKFDNATGASVKFATFLNDVGTAIENVGGNPRLQVLLRALEAFDRFGNSQLSSTAREFEAIGSALDQVAASFDRYGESVSDSDLALGQAEQALSTFAQNAHSGLSEVEAAAQDLFQQVLEGKGSAEQAAAAIAALGEADPNFAPLLDKIGGVIGQIYALRNAAVAATQVDVSTTPMTYAGQEGGKPKVAVKPVSINDYAAPAGSSGGKGSKGGKSGADRFADALKNQQQRIDALNRETQLQSQLNPLVDDYGYAIERLRAQIELENAAKEAGLPLDAQRQQKIDELATGYATATAEAARLAEAQGAIKDSAEAMEQASRSALDTIIDGFLEGKNAGDIFGSMLKDLGRNMLNIGIDLFGTAIKSGGGNPLGFLSGLFGGKREGGGSVQAGKAYLVGEKRPELFVPGRSGTIVPRIPTVQGPATGEIAVHATVSVENGNLVPVITQVSGRVAGQQVKAYDRQLPNRLQDINMRQG